MSDKIEWSPFFLPNIALYDVKLSDHIVNHLWGYINDAKNKTNETLAGNISASHYLVDKDDYFFKEILEPISIKYTTENSIVNHIKSNHTTKSELHLSKFWVNYQYKHEFNPMHSHAGVISFVIWIKIPTESEEQHNIPISKNSNTPSASDFSFAYTDILGNIQTYRIELSSKDNGLMMIFPSSLNHQVYPFYECDEKRVSISGNVCWK